MLPHLVVEREDRNMGAWTLALAIISGVVSIPISIWSMRESWRTGKKVKELRQLMIEKLKQEEKRHD